MLLMLCLNFELETQGDFIIGCQLYCLIATVFYWEEQDFWCTKYHRFMISITFAAPENKFLLLNIFLK